MSDILSQLADTLEQRKGADRESSYVAQLYARGLDTILKKVGEEADAEKIVSETADLWFHTLVMLVHQGLRPEQVLDELQRRVGVSGLEEKAGRGGEQG